MLFGMAALLIASSQPAAAADSGFPGGKSRWRLHRSPHFELYTNDSGWRAVDTLGDLELLRAFFLEQARLREHRPIPVTVFLFADESDFQACLPTTVNRENRLRGLHLPQADRTTILLTPSDNEASSPLVVRHEFVHHLFRVAEENPPVWFNEGMAELYSTVAVERGKLMFGRPPLGRLRALQQEKLMPLEQLVATGRESALYRGNDHTGIFYAQSWLLVHFCHFGAVDIPLENRLRFLAVARSPEVHDNPALLREASRQLLGWDLARLTKELNSYASAGRYQARSAPPPPVPEAKTYTVEDVPPATMRLRLAEVLVRTRQDPRAEFALLEAAGAGDTRASEVLGTLARYKGDMVAMQERWQKALAAETPNPAVAQEYVEHRTRQLFARFDPYYRMPAELGEELRSCLLRSIAATPEQSRAYEMLAWIEASAPEPVVANLNTVQRRFGQLKARDRTLVALACARHHLGKDAEALQLLDQLPDLAPDSWSGEAAETLRAKIEGRKPVREKPGTRPKPPAFTPPIKIKPMSEAPQ
ncbi:MAG: hypothetical protein KF715_15210 [Candidatus Didemnitutus sp.]|nr:hypothetical protein [Candidatus Didemnitutus sp.]